MSSMDWLESAFPDSTNPALRIQGDCLRAGSIRRTAPRTSSAIETQSVRIMSEPAGLTITRPAQPIPNSSIRSSGVPHWRQISAWQSPHTSGSATGWAQVGQ